MVWNLVAVTLVVKPCIPTLSNHLGMPPSPSFWLVGGGGCLPHLDLLFLNHCFLDEVETGSNLIISRMHTT